MLLRYLGQTSRNDFANSVWLTDCGNYQIRRSTFTLSAELSEKWYLVRRVASNFGSGSRWEIIGRHNARKAALRRLLATIRADQRLARRIEREAEIKKHKRRQSSAKRRRKHQRPAKKIQAKLF